MNIKNAAGFFFLGLVMHLTPTFAPSLAVHVDALMTDSVRALWLKLMGLVIGGIGSSYLLRDLAVRMPALLLPLIPRRLLSPAHSQVGADQLPAAARAGVSL